MKQIIIKCVSEHLAFLRTEAMSKAIEFEERHMKDQKIGSYYPVLWIKEGTHNKFYFRVHHTKTSIVVNIGVYGKKSNI